MKGNSFKYSPDFQKKIESFESQLAQNDRELQIFIGENQQLKTAETALRENLQSLENQLAHKATEVQAFREETLQLQTAEMQLQQKVESLENQIAQ